MAKKAVRNRKNGENESQAPQLGKLSGMLDIPPSALAGVSQIEIAGNREAVIDGCQGILEYDENTIKLTTGKMSVKFTGRGLQIKVLTRDSAVIDGFISNIEFIM